MATRLSLQRPIPRSVDEVRAALGAGGRYELAVPAAATAFVKPPLMVSDQRVWHGNTAELTIVVEGQPVRIAGSIALQETDAGCTADFDCTIDADVPFIGAMVESMIKQELVAAIDRELGAITG